MKFITIAEFCNVYRISPRTVWNWVRKGRLKAVRDAGGRILHLVDPEWPILDESNDPDVVSRFAVLKPRDVAVLLGVLPSTVRKRAAQGKLRAVWVGSQRRFSLSELRRAIAEQMLGRKPKNAKETSNAMIQWARWKLSLHDKPSASEGAEPH